ncbi:MAG: glycosyltransferase family 4 protein [Thermodesulfovibrionia bacterium]|nr:glycosyltransferase family 4 protein [Thermodesulfovibrionia bacterium]
MINYEFPPIGGGGGNANFYILKEFAKKKRLNIDLVTSSETSGDHIYKFSDNITVHRLNVRKKRLHYWTQREILEYLFRSSRYVRGLVNTRSYNLIHSFFGFPSGYIAYRNKDKVPYIISLRGSDVPGFNKRFSLQYLFLTPLFRRIWMNAESLIANSKELKMLAQETTPDLPIDVIYNGIDMEEFRPAGHRKSGPFTILTVSRLIKRKCIDYLIRALPAVINVCPDVKLIIAGEGNVEGELRKLVSELKLESKVSFLGRIDHGELPDLYRKADIFVLPSLWEGMSNTLLEAIASGLPVIVTDTGGTEELVKDNGVVVPKENFAAISDAIMRLIRSPDIRIEMGKRSTDIALGFSWGQVAEKYIEVYERSVEEALV